MNMNKFENGFNEAESAGINRQEIIDKLERDGAERQTMNKAVDIWMQNQAV